MNNPFKYGGIVRGPHFADRSEEIQELAREMENNNRVFLVSPRRFGKTCMLHNLGEILEKNGMAWAYIDLNAYPDLRGFAASLATGTAKALETDRDRLLKLFTGFRKLRPKLSMDMEGNVNAGLELAETGEKDAVEAMIEGLAWAEVLAEKKKKRLAVIIDEFSDIGKYDGGTVEKALRSEIQKQEHVGYIFSGSEQTVMLDMVRDSNRAFYKLGRIMKLGPIRRDAYIAFICGWLEKGGYTAEKKDIERILEIGDDVPYNIQRLCNAMWERAMESKKVDSELVEQLPKVVARQDSAHYEMLWQTATQPQKTLLIALSEDEEGLPFSKDFQLKHGVGPSSSIKASLESLAKKGILYKTLEGRYRFGDRFMPFWIADLRQ